jgi:hypothetical protein
METIIPVESLKAVNVGLEHDLQKMQNMQATLLSEVQKYAGKEADEKFTPKYCNQQLAIIASRTEAEMGQIFAEADNRAEEVIAQEPFWNIDGYLRKARITPEPKPIVLDSGLTSEKKLADVLNQQAGAIGDLIENAARQRWLSELERMPRESFLATVKEAEVSKDGALLYLAQLALTGRSYGDDHERAFLKSAVQGAKHAIKFPQREDAISAIDRTKQLQHALRDLKSQVAGSKDLTRWISRQLEFIDKQARTKRYERVN